MVNTNLALFNLAIDSKLRSCDLVSICVNDVAHEGSIAKRATILQSKTQQPVQFEITEQTRTALETWISCSKRRNGDYLFTSRLHSCEPTSTRQYARIVKSWISEIGLDPITYGTHSLRRTKAALIYRRTKNLRAVQLLLGHTKMDYLPRRTMSRYAHVGRPQAAGRVRYGT